MDHVSISWPAGIDVAGTPVGSLDFVRTSLDAVAARAVERVAALHALPLGLQDKHTVLRGSLQHTLDHLPRCLPVDFAMPALDALHRTLKGALTDLWALPPGDALDAQVFLTPRRGGMVYHRLTRLHCHAAFCSAASFVASAFADAQPRLRALHHADLGPVGTAWEHVRRAAGQPLRLPDSFLAAVASGKSQELQGDYAWRAADKAFGRMLAATDGMPPDAALLH